MLLWMVRSMGSDKCVSNTNSWYRWFYSPVVDKGRSMEKLVVSFEKEIEML